MSAWKRTLTHATGHALADHILSGLIGIWESVFPGRVRAYYLLGSYRDGSATPSSDLDVGILFKDSFLTTDETDHAQRLCEHCEALHPAIAVDLWYLSEARAQDADRVAIALQLKFASTLLVGDDTRDQLVAQPDERYVRDAMHIPYFGSRFGRPDVEVLRYPLKYPDPAGEFYGYDGWTVPAVNGAEQPSAKMLVTIVSRIATALIALRSGHYVGSKAESVALYGAEIGDEWSGLVEEVYARCKVAWRYLIPHGTDERQQLRNLCVWTLAFENYFFGIYQSYLLDELRNGQPEDQMRAVERLGQIMYPGQEVLDALKALEATADSALRQAVGVTLDAIQQHTETTSE